MNLFSQIELLTPHHARRVPSPGFTCQRIHVFCRTKTSPKVKAPAGGFQCSRVRFSYRHTPAYSRLYTALGSAIKFSRQGPRFQQFDPAHFGIAVMVKLPYNRQQHSCWPQITEGMAEILNYFRYSIEECMHGEDMEGVKATEIEWANSDRGCHTDSQRKGAVYSF